MRNLQLHCTSSVDISLYSVPQIVLLKLATSSFSVNNYHTMAYELHVHTLIIIQDLMILFILSTLLPLPLNLQDKLCCTYGWSYRILHIFIGFLALGMVGTVVAFTEPQLVQFMLERLPMQSPALAKQFTEVAIKSGIYKDTPKKGKRKKN